MKFHLDLGSLSFPISSCCAMLLSAQKCESQTADGVFCLLVSYFNITIFEIFKALQNGLVRDLQKYIFSLLKKTRTSYVLRKLQNSFEMFACNFFLFFSLTLFCVPEKNRVTLYLYFAYQQAQILRVM